MLTRLSKEAKSQSVSSLQASTECLGGITYQENERILERSFVRLIHTYPSLQVKSRKVNNLDDSFNCVMSVPDESNQEYSAGNGIKLTSDGFVLTNRHIAKDFFESFQNMRGRFGEDYKNLNIGDRIEACAYTADGFKFFDPTIYFIDSDTDLAILKLFLPRGDPKPTGLKFSSDEEVYKVDNFVSMRGFSNDSIDANSLKPHQVILYNGRIMLERFDAAIGSEIEKDTFVIKICSFEGNSGSVVTSEQCEIAGMVSKGTVSHKYTICTKFKYIKSFVRKVAIDLQGDMIKL